jgi:hypothetical protein
MQHIRQQLSNICRCVCTLMSGTMLCTGRNNTLCTFQGEPYPIFSRAGAGHI